ncbi:hypothetical protein Fmac_026330 [Flemingia macrophylla]|uniref:Uncharacterized protein n=1 Tax=Flemingia macrophylla TaxID=520843 RepID=A0ABD1LEQ9_9FABA
MPTRAQQTLLILDQVKLLLKQQLSLVSYRRLVPSSKKVMKCNNQLFMTSFLKVLLQHPKLMEGRVLEGRVAAHPLENVQSLLPPNSWLGLYPVPGELRPSHFVSSAFILNSICYNFFIWI